MGSLGDVLFNMLHCKPITDNELTLETDYNLVGVTPEQNYNLLNTSKNSQRDNPLNVNVSVDITGQIETEPSIHTKEREVFTTLAEQTKEQPIIVNLPTQQISDVEKWREETLWNNELQTKYIREIANKSTLNSNNSNTTTNTSGSVLDTILNVTGGKGKTGLLTGLGGKALNVVKGVVGKAAGVVGKVALPLMIAKGAYDAISAGADTSVISARTGKDNISFYDRVKQGGAGLLSGLTFGLVGTDTIANKGESLINLVTGKGFKTNKELLQTPKEVPQQDTITSEIKEKPIRYQEKVNESEIVYRGRTAGGMDSFYGLPQQHGSTLLRNNSIANANNANNANNVISNLTSQVKLDNNSIANANNANNAISNLTSPVKLDSNAIDKAMQQHLTKHILNTALDSTANNNQSFINNLLNKSGVKKTNERGQKLADLTTETTQALLQPITATTINNNNNIVAEQPRFRLADQSVIAYSQLGGR